MAIQIENFLHVSECAVFREYTWPDDLASFKDYNLIYGWNATGKTTLSKILRCLEKREVPQGTVKLGLSAGRTLSGDEFPTTSMPLEIKVFNKDFIDENVFGTSGKMNPIFVFGETSVEEQKKLETLRDNQERTRMSLVDVDEARKKLEGDIDRLCRDSAKLIKETLRSSGENPYNNYDKGDFKETIDLLVNGMDIVLLPEDQKQQLMNVARSEQKGKIIDLSVDLTSLDQLVTRVRELCARSVLAKTIFEIEKDPSVNDWVGQGLKLHKERSTDKCLFCNQSIPHERIQELESHFSDAYEQLDKDINETKMDIKDSIDNIRSLVLPDSNLFYSDFRRRYSEERAEFEAERVMSQEILEKMSDYLREKKKNILLKVDVDQPAIPSLSENLKRISEVISDHNDRVIHHEEQVRDAREQLEHSLVAEKIDEFRDRLGDIESAKNDIVSLNDRIDGTQEKISDLETRILEQQRPAMELNQDLSSYLGHTDLQFESSDTGYMLVREGKPASSFSEGEKTAIAFLYFLKSLEDKDFNLQDGIVVIDDPISSLDTNSLYHAFGFLKSRVIDANQLFLFTHNFLFFRQVRNWFRHTHKKHKKKPEYYMLQVKMQDCGRRNAELIELDPMLKTYESEYHYLFSLVYKAAYGPTEVQQLGQCHFLPNATRRLLEAFLEFKAPGSGNIYSSIEEVPFNEAKKMRILRFCDTHSHCKVIDGSEDDLSILVEGFSVAKDIMDMIETEDEKHFERMKQLVDL